MTGGDRYDDREITDRQITDPVHSVYGDHVDLVGDLGDDLAHTAHGDGVRFIAQGRNLASLINFTYGAGKNAYRAGPPILDTGEGGVHTQRFFAHLHPRWCLLRLLA